MDAIVDTGRYSGNTLVTLGTCRTFKGIHMVSCLVKCDSREIRPDVLDGKEGQSLRQFPRERPTPAMLETWKDAVALLASEKANGKMCLPSPLGKFLLPPLRHNGWYSSADECTPYYDPCQKTCTAFKRDTDSSAHQTRTTSNKYREVETCAGSHPGTKYASVDELPNGDVTLHSTADLPQTAPRTRSFLETLHSFPNQTLWNDLTLDKDGEWISKGLNAGTLVLVHDGSCNKNLDPTKCSAACIIMCRKTKNRLQGTVVEKARAPVITE